MEDQFIVDDDLVALSELSQSIGNIPLVRGQSAAAILRDQGKIIGFAAVQNACHAAGSWIHPDHRGKSFSYRIRKFLEQGLKERGIEVYFSLPNTAFEKILFAKYGPCKERIVQVRVI